MTGDPTIDQLPSQYHWLAPELTACPPPREKAADCANCPMVQRPDEPDPPRRMVFHPDLKCCTYNPVIYNFSVGRVLRRGGAGAERMRARLTDMDGVNPYAIRPVSAFYERARSQPRGGFGTDPERKCPYWVDVPGQNCSIWQERNAVCRAWFCQHDAGANGRAYWDSFRDLLWALQVKLSRWIADQLEAPEGDDLEAWCAYFVRCAEVLDGASEAEVRALQDDGLVDTRDAFRAAWEQLHDDRIPEFLGPCVTAFYDLGEAVKLEGYSHYSPSIWPKGIWVLFSVMDGTKTWRQALDHANETLGDGAFTEGDIREMVRLGILERRVPEDLEVGVRLRGVPAGRVSEESQDMVVFDWPF